MASRIENALVTFSKIIEAVNQLADLDRGLIDQTIQQLKERDTRLKTANVDNHRLLAGNTLTNLEGKLNGPGVFSRNKESVMGLLV